MVAVLLTSIGILFVAIAASLVLMFRSGETRVGLITLACALLGVRQGIALWMSWDGHLAFDATGLAEISVLAASVIGLLVLAAQWLTLAERDRAESLHWNSMEAVRILGELAERSELNLDEKFSALLKVGCERFDLEIGAISRVEGQRYEVIAIRAPEGFPISRGAVLMLADTCCDRALTSLRPVALERVEPPTSRGDGGRPSFGFRSYLGGTIRVYDEVIGTLCFGGRAHRRRRFTATDKDLLNLMSQWVGTELERSFAAEARRASAAGKAEAVPAPPARPPRRDVRLRRSVDVNATIRRAEANLRALVGADVDLDLRLAEDLGPSVPVRFPVGAIVESLVLESARALSAGDRIEIETANLEVANAVSGVVPAVAPDHYVTISVRASGSGIEAERFGQGFESPRNGPTETVAGGLPRRMPIAAVYRALQRCGGDLSLEVESGKASTFTVYLPRAGDEAAERRPPPPLAAPGEPT